MSERRRLIIVSNRGPVGYDRDGAGRRIARRGAGGLVTALRPLVSRHDVTWIASAMTDDERELAGEGTFEETAANGSPFRLRFVAHDPEAYELYYNVVANPVLWFVHHGLWALRHDADADLTGPWRDGYTVVNDAFAAAVVDELDVRPDAVVLLQDYHLYLVPRRVREQVPRAVLSHFVHIPWPEPEEWRVLPEPIRRELHESLLANDVVGFHTERWRRAFVASSEDELGAGERADAGRSRRPSLSTRRSSRPSPRSPAVLAREAELRRGASRAADPASRPRRPGEERGSWLSRVRTAPRAPAGSPRPRRHGRAARSLARADPRVPGVPRRDRERRREVGQRFARDGWRPLRVEVRDDFPSPSPRTSSSTFCSSTRYATA